MQKRIFLISLFFFLAICVEVNSVIAGTGEEVNLTNFPLLLADRLSISDFAGRVLASILLCMTFILPTAIYAKNIVAPLIVGVLCLGACIAIGWLDYWFLLIIAMLVAFMFGSKMSEIITGVGKR